jgi:hypothetical protein
MEMKMKSLTQTINEQRRERNRLVIAQIEGEVMKGGNE